MVRAALAVLIALPLLSACSWLPWMRDDARVPDAYVLKGDMPGALEAIHAAAFTGDEALFKVASNGCTQKSDIQPVVQHTPSFALVTLRRIKEDTCEQVVVGGVEVVYSFDELGLKPGEHIRVNNPYLQRD